MSQSYQPVYQILSKRKKKIQILVLIQLIWIMKNQTNKFFFKYIKFKTNNVTAITNNHSKLKHISISQMIDYNMSNKINHNNYCQIPIINLRKINKRKSKIKRQRWWCDGGKEFKGESKGRLQLGFQVIKRSEGQGQQ